ncbi:MAG: iron-sulfur cluster assembly scaffold protein [Proteobacteria bacterium]|nr:iron-sulfur cluster assembly scaffold protein [Pseudomonadota bacterium]
MNKEPDEFWQNHSMRFLEMAFDYKRHEKVHEPDSYGKNTGSCGDTVEMYLIGYGDTIRHVSLSVDGCINTNACANTVAQFVEGKTLEEAWDVTPEQVADYLETLPENSVHCAELAVGALYHALSDYESKKGSGKA